MRRVFLINGQPILALSCFGFFIATPGLSCPVSAVLLFRDPVPDVLRAVEQGHPGVLALSQKANSLQIDQPEFL